MANTIQFPVVLIYIRMSLVLLQSHWKNAGNPMPILKFFVSLAQ